MHLSVNLIQRNKLKREKMYLVTVPGLGSLSARSLAGGDAKHLGGHADGALDLELLLLGAVDQKGAD